MCCAINCLLKIVLSILNSLLLIMGIVLVVLGSLLLWGFNYLMKGIYSIESQIHAMLTKFGVSGNGQEVLDLMKTNANTIGAIAFGVGIILIIFAVLGIVFVICCDLRCILIAIVAIVIVIALALIILIGVFGVNKTEKVLNPLLKFIQEKVINKYQGINATNPESILANVIQISLKCCGLNNYKDFNNATKFDRKISHAENIQLQFPISCCEYRKDFTIDGPTLKTCVDKGTSFNKNHGCWELVKPKVEKYLGYCFTTIGITIGILFAVVIVGVVAIFVLEKAP